MRKTNNPYPEIWVQEAWKSSRILCPEKKQERTARPAWSLSFKGENPWFPLFIAKKPELYPVYPKKAGKGKWRKRPTVGHFRRNKKKRETGIERLECPQMSKIGDLRVENKNIFSYIFNLRKEESEVNPLFHVKDY